MKRRDENTATPPAADWVLVAMRTFKAGADPCPLCPQKRTLELSRGMSALCQKQTFDRLFVGAGEDC